MIFFWADTHFNHAGIIGHCARPYASVREMNEALIERWNSVITKETDEVWLLGDFGFVPAKANPDAEDLGVIFHRLRGRKSLIVGNHDERNPQVLKLPWGRVEKLHTVKSEGRKAVLCHYPIESWPGAHNGVLHFHGHSHGNLKRKVSHRFDVGADVHEVPVSWEDLAAVAASQVFAAADHHGDL